MRITRRSSPVDREAPTVALVATLRGIAPVLPSFISYHLAIVFDRLYLFFDDPTDSAIALARTDPRVTAIVDDGDLQKRWTGRPSDDRITAFLATEVMARQLRNVDVAVGLARREGVDWLLHVDGDELLYTPQQTVREHFRALSRRGIRRAVYLNYEAVPETAYVADYFREVTLFKRNPAVLGETWSAAKRGELAAQVPQIPPRIFHFYSNGKSAARVRPGLTAPGVHGFRQPEESRGLSLLLARVRGSRPGRAAARSLPPFDRTLAAVSRWSAGAVIRESPAILHYACCGFEHFWAKYRTLGAFADQWFGRDDIASRIGSFHLESRDVVGTGDQGAAFEFYLRRMVLSDRSLADRLVREGVCRRIKGPSTLLAGEAARSGQQGLEQRGADHP